MADDTTIVILFVFMFIVVVLGLGGLGFYFYKKKKDTAFDKYRDDEKARQIIPNVVDFSYSDIVSTVTSYNPETNQTTTVDTDIDGSVRTVVTSPDDPTQALRKIEPVEIVDSDTGTGTSSGGDTGTTSSSFTRHFKEPKKLSGGEIVTQLLTDKNLWYTIAIQLPLDMFLSNPNIIQDITKSVKKFLGKDTASILQKSLVKEGDEMLSKFGVKIAGESADDIAKAGLGKIDDVATQLADEIDPEKVMRVLDDVAEKAGAKASQLLAIKTSAKAASKAGTKIAEKTAMAAATGPAMPFVEAAEFAFSAISGYMDSMNLGGFANLTNMRVLNDMRDEVNYQLENSIIEAGKTWPIVVGPLLKADPDDISKLAAEIYMQFFVQDDIKSIFEKLAKGEIETPPDLTDTQSVLDFIQKTIVEGDYVGKAFPKMMGEICKKKGGIYMDHPTDKTEKVCTYNETACEPPWPIKQGDMYYEYSKKDNVCHLASSIMRSKCEGLGFGVKYNKETGSCDLTSEYCTRYGSDEGLGADGDCKSSNIAKIMENILGTTISRSILNIVSPNAFEECGPGNINPFSKKDKDKPKDIKEMEKFSKSLGSITNGGGFGAFFCVTDDCDEGQDKVNGLCYDSCPAGYSRKADTLGTTINGMCYGCDDGYEPSSAGLCTKSCPEGTERGGASIGMCYDKCKDGETTDGATQCIRICPDGYNPMAATCDRPSNSITTGKPKTCPEGWYTSIPGPGGMCQKQCGEGQKLYAGTCYDKDVDTSLLIKGGKWTCPRGKLQGVGPLCSDLSTTWVKNKGLVTRGGTFTGDISCPSGYYENGGMCYARSHGIVENKSMLEVGVCPAGKLSLSGMCYDECPDGYKRLAGTGTCFRPDDIISRHPYTREGKPAPVGTKMANTVGPQKEKGVSLKISLRKRKVPYPATSKKDFSESTLGKRMYELGDGIKNGDVSAIGKSWAAISIIANPMTAGLGLTELADMGLRQAGI
jgi:hypothetical protein